MSVSGATRDIPSILKELGNIHYLPGPLLQRIQRYKCLISHQNGELEAIYNLIESHSPGLRSKAVLRYEKLLATDEDSACSISPLVLAKESIGFKCSVDERDKIGTLLRQIRELPKEWTLVQLTPQYSPLDNINEDVSKFHTGPIHMTVFNCGQTQEEPFMVTVQAPKDPVKGTKLELVQEMMSIIVGNKEALTSNNQKAFKNLKEKMEYFSRRDSIEDRLRAIIKDIQNLWLKEWRCLLNGKYIDGDLELQIKTEISNFLKSEVPELDVPGKTRAMLGYIVKAGTCLKSPEIRRAIQYCFPQIDDKTVLKNIARFIRGLGDKLIVKGVNDRKYPLILILDDSLDCFPWEMIDVLQDEPVSRLPSFHFVYSLYKEHEKDIIDGFKVVSDHEKGAYIVNPDMDLKNMEIRIMKFFNYWTPNWTGVSGVQPGGEKFLELLTSSEIFSYNGHGSGSHLLSMEKIQRTHVKAVVLLFGCGSTKLNRLDAQVEMYGPYHMYLIARCPCVVGMLWEVTDLDTDTLSTQFMSLWVPSKAPTHWKYVDRTRWNKAEEKLKFLKSNALTDDENNRCEPELSRALNLAKKSVMFYGTRSACVVRGLPVRIQIDTQKLEP